MVVWGRGVRAVSTVRRSLGHTGRREDLGHISSGGLADLFVDHLLQQEAGALCKVVATDGKAHTCTACTRFSSSSLTMAMEVLVPERVVRGSMRSPMTVGC